MTKLIYMLFIIVTLSAKVDGYLVTVTKPDTHTIQYKLKTVQSVDSIFTETFGYINVNQDSLFAESDHYDLTVNGIYFYCEKKKLRIE